MGPGGVGKTRVAVALALQFADEPRAEARFVGLASISDPALVAGTVAEALGFPEIDAASLGARLARRAATGRCSWYWTTSSTCWRRVGS